MRMFRWIIKLNDSNKSFGVCSLFQALRWGSAARSKRAGKKRRMRGRKREEEREEVPLLSPPTLPPVVFCSHISLRNRHHLKAWNSQGITAVTCDQRFFSFQDKGIIGRGYDLRLSRIRGIRGSTESVMVLSLKERRRTHGWYPVKKAGKRMQDKSLLTETRGQRRKIHGVAFFPLVLLLLFQTQN